jgi:hypothetical protein
MAKSRKERALDEFKEFVIGSGFGKLTKVEYDEAVLRLFIASGLLPKKPTIKDLVDWLRVPMQKARTLHASLDRGKNDARPENDHRAERPVLQNLYRSPPIPVRPRKP